MSINQRQKHERYICVWPDAVWYDENETNSVVSWRGNDYRTILVHPGMTDVEVDEIAIMAANGCTDDAITDEIVYWLGG